MKLIGYGYRKNCFGETIFYEDELIVGNPERIEKYIKKGLSLSRENVMFSFKIIDEDTGECWAVRSNDWDKINCMFSVIYSKAWNSTDPETKMSAREFMKLMREHFNLRKGA